MTISRRSLVWGSALVCGAAAASAPRQSLARSAVEDFFRGKTIRVLVGTTPGAGYDLVARLLAAHMAFDATMRDPAFAQDMKKSNIPLRPVSGPQVQRLIRETYAAPEQMLERLREAVTP